MFSVFVSFSVSVHVWVSVAVLIFCFGGSGLDKVWDVKPLLNGKEIIDALQLKSGGPVVSKWVKLIYSNSSTP